MDGQRADGRASGGHPSDGRGWYDDNPYGEASNRYAPMNEDPYAQSEGFDPYANDQYSASSGRSRSRRGQRSGLMIPDASGYGEEAGDAQSQYADQYGYPAELSDYSDPAADDQRLSARDRQQLRERASQVSPPAPQPGTYVAGSPISVSPGAPIFGAPAAGPALQAPTEAIPAGARQTPTATYRSRRPGLAVLLAFAGVIAELILLKVLLGNFLHSTSAGISGTFAALFALAGTPMTLIGLYGLATGAATASGPNTGRAWLRTPLAYLPVGLVLILAAGLAA